MQTKENGKKRILVVDDNGAFLRTVKVMLEPEYEVLLAKSGERGLTTAVVEHPDLILLDYEMPEWDGRKTLEMLRQSETTKAIPVIFLTAVRDRENIVAVLKMQPQGYILKPANRDEVLAKIREVIGE